MFDVGALELLVIAVVALIVVGPERLPKLARTAGLWAGRARRALSSVKDEIDREMKAEELKEILRKQAQSRPLDTILEEAVGTGSTRTEQGRSHTKTAAATSTTASDAASAPAPASNSGTETASQTASADSSTLDETFKDRS
jgi:sec-independent protein translocase protein TatB